MRLTPDPQKRFSAFDQAFFFLMYAGETAVLCKVPRNALYAIGDAENAEEIFVRRRPEIERVASAKFHSEQLDVTSVVTVDTWDWDH